MLEFVPSNGLFPVSFEAESGVVTARLGDFNYVMECTQAEGEGQITGARTTLSSYAFKGCEARPLSGMGSPLNCKSAGAAEKEITSAEIEADLVYLDQANHEAAMLLNPGGGIYLEFECGANPIKASGSFLAPVGPVNQMTSSFTAALKRNGNSQIPTEYEDSDGVKHQAVPTAEVNSEPPDTSGVELAFTVHPSVPLEIRAFSRAEVEAKRSEEEAAKKRQEEEAAAKKRQEEEAAAKKRAEEEAAVKMQQEEAEARARKHKLTKALKQCRKVKSKSRHARCIRRAHKRYGPHRVG